MYLGQISQKIGHLSIPDGGLCVYNQGECAPQGGGVRHGVSFEESTVGFRKLEDYLALPYTVEIYPDNGDEPTCFYARIVEFPGTLVQAECPAKLEERLEAAKRAWIEAALRKGQPIPVPQVDSSTATDAYPRRDELLFN